MGVVDVEFYKTLRTMRQVSNEALLTDTFPPSDPHNISARILRHGLSVSAFSVLEKYTEAKISELISEIAKCGIPYAHLTVPLKKFLTVDAVSGLSNRLNFLDGTDELQFAEANIALIASYHAPAATYTALGFSPRGSNVSDKDIQKAFAACGVSGAWARMSGIVHQIGGGRLSLSEDYRNLAKTRHRSAHNPGGNVPTADLQTHIETAALIGVGVAVLCRWTAAAYAASPTPASLVTSLGTLGGSYRFVDEQVDGSWVERVSVGGRAIKRYPDENSAVSGAAGRAKRRPIIVRDLRLIPVAVH